ncbi:DEKNAAC105097 [Brettanomyces naardenensis]|uniref:Mediator of RNA polymerase II transcription subunit 6 n=1 Tax=Brettanomyces naardenensis TaxID=13370 RepID=A0A448YSR8_BRENA|nr:DEKNAAC105097 [Brettanomyces naardenensis]
MDNTPLDELQWKSPEWVNTFGLRTDNVLEYFSQSPFFDRTSNNQVLKMQNQFSDANYISRPYQSLVDDLKKMRGIEFIIAMVREPDFWVIRKEHRHSETEVRTLADFYIIGSSVYMAPSIHAILSSRLLSTSLNLRNAISLLQELPNFSPSRGHYYEFNSNEGNGELRKPETKQLQQGEEAFKLPDSTSNAFSNLLSLSLQRNSVYLDEMPVTGINEAALLQQRQQQQRQLPGLSGLGSNVVSNVSTTSTLPSGIPSPPSNPSTNI